MCTMEFKNFQVAMELTSRNSPMPRPFRFFLSQMDKYIHLCQVTRSSPTTHFFLLFSVVVCDFVASIYSCCKQNSLQLLQFLGLSLHSLSFFGGFSLVFSQGSFVHSPNIGPPHHSVSNLPKFLPKDEMLEGRGLNDALLS